MESERFEALVDAILAIIITIIVMEIPLPQMTTWQSLFELYPDFIAYTMSFIICFIVWNYHHNLFNIVNRINSTITWTSAISMMIIGLLPHVTTMIAENFYSFTAQFLFGLMFVVVNINFFVVDELLVRADKANIALRLMLKNRKQKTIYSMIFYFVGIILGYLYYPPLVSVFCMFAIIMNLLPVNVLKKIRLPFIK